MSVHGNSAQVGVETLIRRLESWRHTLADWAEERIFKPIAEMQGFVDEEKSEEVGEICYLYPKINWNDLELKDKTQWYQVLMQLHDKQVISTQTLLEEMDLDFDQEIKRQRYEQIQVGPAGGMLGMGGAGGAGAGGMGMGGMGGGPGGMPGGEMGGPGGMMPGMPGGDMGAGGGAGGMPGGGGAMGPMAGGGAGQKITKKGKQQDKQEQVPMPMVKLTRIEQEMAHMLIDLASAMNLPTNNIKAQFPIQNPNGGKPYMLDFALPNMKLCVEADGETYHNSPEQETHDKERDYLLAQRGWTVLRFDDRSIEESPQAVKQTIAQFIKQLMQSKKKTASTKDGNINTPRLFTANKGKLIHLVGDMAYEKYFEPKRKFVAAFK